MKLRPARILRKAVELGLRELPLLVITLFVGGGLWAFLEIAEEVSEGDVRAIDRTILLAFRNSADVTDPLGPGWVEEMGRDFTALGGIPVLSLITLAAAIFLLLQRKRHAALFVVVAVVGGMLLSNGLKSGFDRPRPDLVPHGAVVYTASFPSGHAMLSAVVYLTLGALLARLQRWWRLKIYLLVLAVLVTLIVGISRIYLGVHWPTDVLAGWAAGATWAMLCWGLALWLQARGKVETEPGNVA